MMNIGIPNFIAKGIAEWKFQGWAMLREWWYDDSTDNVTIWIQTDKPKSTITFYFYPWYMRR